MKEENNMVFSTDGLKFDEKGLIPVIVQDFYTKKVLMLAYMNEESLKISLDEKRTCFYSRSRKELWRKGETSGNVQHLVSLKADCDADCLLAEVIKDGPACHTGNESCFFNDIYSDETASESTFSLEELYKIISKRYDERPQDSYTTYLFDKGKEKISKKLAEEASEVVIADIKGDKKETVYELADLCYHALVLMKDAGIELKDVKKELSSRHNEQDKKYERSSDIKKKKN